MSENGSRKPGRKQLKMWLIVMGGLVLAVAVVWLPKLAEAIAEGDREVVTLSNMRGIANSMAIYASENQGAIPDMAVLEEIQLTSGYFGSGYWPFHDTRLGKRKPPALRPGMSAAEKKKVLEDDNDFWFCDPDTWKNPATVDQGLIVFYDKGKAGVRRLMVFGDGQASGFAQGSAELREVVKRNNDVRRRLGLPLLPEDLMGPPGVVESATAKSRGASGTP